MYVSWAGHVGWQWCGIEGLGMQPEVKGDCRAQAYERQLLPKK